MKVTPTELQEVLLIEPRVFEDPRGFFMESYHQHKFDEAGIDARFVQDNHSRSCRGTLRGLHYQLEHAQGKLVRVVSGEVFDVAVDIRKGSPTFGRWMGVILSDENRLQLYVPPGFAHGFCTLSESADFEYKCTDFYAPEDEHGIRWNDPDIGVTWPDMDYILSDKDENSPLLKDLDVTLPTYQE